MVAQVLPYIGPYRYALEVATSGRLGKVKGGYFKRIISNPDWIPDFYESDRVGGPMVDLHVHDAHFIGLLLGKPRSVMASVGARMALANSCKLFIALTIHRSVFPQVVV